MRGHISKAFHTHQSPRKNWNTPSPEALDYLHKRVKTSDIAERTRKSQIDAGYKPDNWDKATLKDLGTDRLLSLLLKGPKSLILPDDNSLESLKKIEERIKNNLLPPATSNYFASFDALRTGLIHDKSLGKITDPFTHYHNLTQVAKPRDKETGKELFEHRSNCGVFTNIPSYLQDLPIAVAVVKENEVQEFIMNDGQKVVVDLGKGGSLQVVVPMLALPYFHSTCSHIIHQDHDGTYGIARPQIDANGRVEWKFNNESKAAERPLIVGENGIIETKEVVLLVDEKGQATPSFRS